MMDAPAFVKRVKWMTLLNETLFINENYSNFEIREDEASGGKGIVMTFKRSKSTIRDYDFLLNKLRIWKETWKLLVTCADDDKVEFLLVYLL